MANTYLTRTPSSAGNRRTFTISTWVKRSSIASGSKTIFGIGNSSSSTSDADWFSLAFNGSTNRIRSVQYNTVIFDSNRLFRDTSAWYHIVYAVDTTQGTASDRVKVYINGVQETSFATVNYPSQNYDFVVNTTVPHMIGREDGNGSGYFDGSMSYVALVDGTAELPTIFGETDSVTGQWKIKTDITPSVAWGTNGFLILKNGNSLTDESTNSNNFTLGGGTLTNTLDCPANVFATFNSLARFPVAPTYSNGNNTTTAGAGGSGSSPFSTIGASSGKYYAELSLGSVNGGGISCGIIDITQFNPNFQTDAWFYYPTYGYAYMSSNGNKGNNNAETSYANSYTNGDRIGVAMDLDNNKLYFAKNGVWQNSGDPTSGATGTGAAFTIADGTYGFAVYGYQEKVWYANFGNGTFGTSAVTSAGTAGSTPGTFEYDVPSGYEPLTTKGLNA